MKSDPRCIPCITNQIMRSVLNGGASLEEVFEAGHMAIDILKTLSRDLPPNMLTSRTLIPILKKLGYKDPYRKLKDEEIRIGKKVLPQLKKIVTNAPDRLRTACLIAATGNIIDIGAQQNYDIEKSVEEIGKKGFKIDNFSIFKNKLEEPKSILYVLDNTGELFFDRILIEELTGHEITAVVIEFPIHNDATSIEAEAAGIDKFAKIITTGDGSLGVDWDKSSDEFIDAYRHADLVIGKGHANFESLIDGERDAFLILKAKCPVVGDKIGVEVGDLIFYYYSP